MNGAGTTRLVPHCFLFSDGIGRAFYAATRAGALVGAKVLARGDWLELKRDGS